MRRLVVVWLVVLGVSLAACGGGPEATPTASGRSSAPATPDQARTPPANARVTLKVAPAPVAQSASGQAGFTAFHGRVRPAQAGAPVVLERRTAPGQWEEIARTVQLDGGRYHGTFRAQRRETLRARSAPAGTDTLVASAPRPRITWPLRFEDTFSGDSLDTSKWYTRHQPMFGSRMCAQPAEDRLRIGDGLATLSVRRFDERRTSTCPYGRFHNAMIGTTQDHRFRYGVFAARIKFQTGQGMHGAFWLQGPSETGAEIDTAEYFGDDSPERITILIHHTDSAGEVRTAGKRDTELPTERILGPGRTPSNGFHVYSVEWSPEGYRFHLDGQLMMTTRKPFVAEAPEEIILSLLTSDWELKRLTTTKPVMQVDWVRVWQAS